MSTTELTNKYFIALEQGDEFMDITQLVDGVRILKIDGFLSLGKPINIYTAQWINEQEEDFMITTNDQNQRPVVIRENTNIEVTFIISPRYANNKRINVATQHQQLINLLTSTDVYILSSYTGLAAHCICVDEYTPTTIKLQRNQKSFILGTLKLHTLNRPSTPTP